MSDDISEATARNITRKSAYADHVQIYNGVPLWSWLEINPTDFCNRSCSFCPHATPDKFPNLPLFMSAEVAQRMTAELIMLKYEGAVVLSGFGEPLLHSAIVELCRSFGRVGCRFEIVTNGDRLSKDLVQDLVAAGVNFFVISLYDHPDQVRVFREMFDSMGLDSTHYLLRDRWHGPDKQYGLKLTNRAGMVETGPQPPLRPDHPCHYPSYSMTVDWNGDVLLCMQDWSRRVRFGNVHDKTLLDIWSSPPFMRRRRDLMRRRDKAPCNGCNADGMVHGKNHVEAWNAWGLI